VGTGPGQIPIKLALRLPDLQVIGIDLSEAMLTQARSAAATAGVANRVRFQTGDASHLPFSDGAFDLVMCNSLLHHSADPVATLNEMARVTRPQGALLLKDLRRPPAMAFRIHVAWHGRHYRGVMKRLFIDSVRAALTLRELEELLAKSEIEGGRVFRSGQCHIGIERRSPIAGNTYFL
jgi:ubiquinone/menaquinone biosynthesis C-methylase UbiE